MTDVAYPSLTRWENAFKDIVWDNFTEAGIAALFAAMPGLAVWPLGPILRSILKLFSGKLFEALRLVTDVQAIAFVNQLHKQEFDSAAAKLWILEKDLGLESPEYRKAKEDAKDRFSQYVRFGNR